MSKTSRFDTRTLVTLSMLTGVALVVMYLSKFIPSVSGFLDFDFKDVVICISGFTFGPFAAAILSILVPVIQMFIASTTGPIGLIMNVLSTASFCCTASVIYKKRHTMSGAVLGLGLGVVVMTGVMLLWNYLITPLYMTVGGTLVSRSYVAKLLPTLFLPFNLVKGGMNMGATLLLYKPVVSALRRAGLVPSSSSSAPRRFSGGFVLFSLAVLVTFITLALVLLGII